MASWSEEKGQNEFTVLTWNIWFGQKSEKPSTYKRRMAAVARELDLTKPDVVMLQEDLGCLPDSYLDSLSPISLFTKHTYNSSCFVNTQNFRIEETGNKRLPHTTQGRWLSWAVLTSIEDKTFKVKVATTHLESPVPSNLNVLEREAQLVWCLKTLTDGYHAGVVFGADFNWIEANGPMDLGPGWTDTGVACGETSPTYDCKTNPHVPMFSSRLDRILTFAPIGPEKPTIQARNIKPIGTTAHGVPPPSDHYGLYATFGLS